MLLASPSILLWGKLLELKVLNNDDLLIELELSLQLRRWTFICCYDLRYPLYIIEILWLPLKSCVVCSNVCSVWGILAKYLGDPICDLLCSSSTFSASISSFMFLFFVFKFSTWRHLVCFFYVLSSSAVIIVLKILVSDYNSPTDHFRSLSLYKSLFRSRC